MISTDLEKLRFYSSDQTNCFQNRVVHFFVVLIPAIVEDEVIILVRYEIFKTGIDLSPRISSKNE